MGSESRFLIQLKYFAMGLMHTIVSTYFQCTYFISGKLPTTGQRQIAYSTILHYSTNHMGNCLCAQVHKMQ